MIPTQEVIIQHYGREKPYAGKEDDLQAACAAYLAIHPTRPVFTHPPNGGYRKQRKNSRGEVYSPEAQRFKKMGVRPGVCDLLIFEPAGPYHGLFIELKAKGGSLTDNQEIFIRQMLRRGYMAVVCWNFDAFKKIFDNYLREG